MFLSSFRRKEDHQQSGLSTTDALKSAYKPITSVRPSQRGWEVDHVVQGEPRFRQNTYRLHLNTENGARGNAVLRLALTAEALP